MRYDEAYRSDLAAKCAGMEDPPFMEDFLDEISAPIELEAEPRLSSPAEVMAWSERANAVIGRGR